MNNHNLYEWFVYLHAYLFEKTKILLKISITLNQSIHCRFDNTVFVIMATYTGMYSNWVKRNTKLLQMSCSEKKL